MNYRLISKNKIFLMGIAMILVAIFHSPFIISNNILMYIKNKLYIGVDIFLFLSGIGIYYSYTKNNNKKYFYKKRFLRILPVTMIITILFSFSLFRCNYLTETDFWASISFANFLLNIGNFPIWYWYIPSILILYLFSPFVIDSYNKCSNKRNFYILTFIIVFILLLLSSMPSMDRFKIFTTRIPIYLIGLKFGELSFKDKYMPKSHIVFYLENALLAIGIIFFLDKHPNDFSGIISNVLLLFPVIAFSIISSLLLNKFKFCKFKVINFIGTITLEIYLLHERMIILGNYVLWNIFKINYNYTIYSIGIFLVTVVFAYFINYSMNKLLYKTKKA